MYRASLKFIIQTNKCTTYIHIYIYYNVSTPAFFSASAVSSESLILLFAKVTKIMKIIKFNKISRLKCLLLMIKYILYNVVSCQGL